MLGAAIRRRFALLSALVVFVAGALALTATHHTQPLPVPRAQAIAAAVHSPRVREALTRVRWDRIEVDAVDNQLERVVFLDGDREVGEVAVNRHHRIVEALNFTALQVPYGDWIAYEPGVLVLLAALFVLASAVAPWRRLRNLDVLMALSLLAPVLLLQHRYVGLSVISGLPGLLYLAARCARVALFQARQAEPSVPVLELVTPEWRVERRVRLLRLLVVVMALILLFVTVSSFDAVDVVYAVMEGATKLVGGVLPYGHLPGDVIHGDTYPLLSYALYVPLAWLSPVQSVWDSVDLALGLAVLATLLIGWAVFRVVAGTADRGARRMAPERELAGLRSALAWLAFPPVPIVASSGTSDVVLGAIVALAVLMWRRPGVCSALLAAGAWFKLGPLALLPVRLASLRRGGLVRAIAGIAAVSAPMLVLLFALGGPSGPMTMVHAISFQFSRESPQSVWSALGITGLQPLGEAAVFAFIAAAAVRLRQEPELANSRQRMAALTAVILIGLQLAANYWAFLYLVWVFPLLAMSVLGEPVAVAVRSEVVAPLPREVGLGGAPA
jgi:Glycosyltransferase family 87